MKKGSIALLALGAVSVACADDDLLPANRPNFSSNAEVVPFRMCILETGATYQRSGASLNLSGIEGEIRLGFAHDWEFDLFIPNYISGARPRGWTDGGFGFVRALPSCHGWNMVFAAGATVPTGQADLKNEAINPNAYFSVDHDLGKDLALTDTVAIAWVNTGGSLIPNYSNALMVAKDLGGGIGAFAELFTQAARGSQTSETLNFGYTFAHNKSQQCDFHFGRTISARSDTNWFVGVGYSQKLSK